MRVAIVGPPQSGKTTLLSALSKERALSHYGETSIERTVKKVDPRLDVISEAHRSRKTVYPEIVLEEIVSLRVGKKESINQRIRLADCIVAVFREKNQLQEILDEFVLQDLETVEKRIEAIKKEKKKGKAVDDLELKTLTEIKGELERGGVHAPELTKREKKVIVKNFQLLSYKPLIPILNTDSYSSMKRDGNILVANLDLEREISLSSPEEKNALMKEFGIGKLLVDSLIDRVFESLNLIMFFTSGPKESRAWPIEKGTRAIEAAGKIHSDMERGFIRAEVYRYEDFIKYGKSEKVLREKGLIRVEGKDYIIKDGDVVYFRFNV